MAISVKFMKMHALGNDFVVIDAVTQNVRLDGKQIRHITDRHFGIGCDQLLMVEPPNSSELDFFCRIFNADGSEVTQCGNGMRCVGRFVRELGLISQKIITLSTRSTTVTIEHLEHPMVRVNLGAPHLEAKSATTLNFLNQSKQAYLLNLGNPHCVIFVGNVDNEPLQTWGEALQHHERFPSGVNLSLVECLARNHIKMRVFERGVGETLACGSAASAAVISGILAGQLGPDVRVDLPGGALTVNWPQQDKGVWLIGPAVAVYQGQFVLNQLPPFA